MSRRLASIKSVGGEHEWARQLAALALLIGGVIGLSSWTGQSTTGVPAAMVGSEQAAASQEPPAPATVPAEGNGAGSDAAATEHAAAAGELATGSSQAAATDAPTAKAATDIAPASDASAAEASQAVPETTTATAEAPALGTSAPASAGEAASSPAPSFAVEPLAAADAAEAAGVDKLAQTGGRPALPSFSDARPLEIAAIAPPATNVSASPTQPAPVAAFQDQRPLAAPSFRDTRPVVAPSFTDHRPPLAPQPMQVRPRHRSRRPTSRRWWRLRPASSRLKARPVPHPRLPLSRSMAG